MKYLKYIFLFAVLESTLAILTEPPPCSTPACAASAALLKSALNHSVNACDDFYQFACGTFLSTHEIPQEKSSVSTGSVLNKQKGESLHKELRDINLATDVHKHSSSVAFTAYVYQKCVELGKQSNETGLRQLKELVHSVLGDRSWNIGMHLAPLDHAWHDNVIHAFVVGVPSVFQLSVGPDMTNVTKNIFTLDPSPLGMGDKELSNLTANAQLVKVYKEFIRNSAKLFCGDKCQHSLENDIDDIVHLESELAKIASRRSARSAKAFKKLSFKQLTEKTHFDWLAKFFQPILKRLSLSDQLSTSDSVLLSDIDYVVKAIEIVNKTSPRTFANYIGWRIVAQYGPQSSEQLRQYNYEFDRLNSGVKKLEERTEACLKVMHTNLAWALSRLFVEKHFSVKEKQEAAKIIDSIQDAYRHLIETNAWLDSETTKASLNKLNHVKKNVAYPDWLLKNDHLDEFYSLQNKSVVAELLAEKNYLKSVAQFSKIQASKLILSLNKPIDLDKSWPEPPIEFDAAYNPFQNSISITAGILKLPIFSIDRPFAMNYGAAGMAIGHELTHGLDDQGSQFDERGNLHNWWSEEAAKRFKNRSECFVKQYGAIQEPSTKLYLNGQNTLGENIADNGGVNEAFHAFQVRQSKSLPKDRSPRLADLPQFNSEQLFFLSFAYTWCGKMRPEKLRLMIEYDPHSPPQYRVNVPLMNSPDFSRVFKCPVGSRMNPAKKCSVW